VCGRLTGFTGWIGERARKAGGWSSPAGGVVSLSVLEEGFFFFFALQGMLAFNAVSLVPLTGIFTREAAEYRLSIGLI
jgi:hypothetical protein